MAAPPAHRIRAWRQERGLTLEALAAEIGMSHANLGRIERGLVPLGEEHLAALARALGVDVPELFRAPGESDTKSQPRAVKLVGFVGAGAVAHYYANADDPNEFVDAPDDATETTVAGEVRGSSLGPFFERWLLFWDEVRTPVTPDLYGQLCVVGLPDGRILVKQIKPTPTPHHFHLLSNANEEPIFDQEVLWAARVTSMRPR